MSVLLLFVLIFATAVLFGVWRRFTSVQWIWLLFGTSMALLLLWLIIIVFFVGPGMRRMIQFGGQSM